MKTHFLIVVFAAFLLIAATPPALVVNGNFDAGLTGWTSGTISAQIANTGLSNAKGNFALLPNVALWSNTFSVKPGATYTLKFSYGAHVGSKNDFTPMICFPETAGGDPNGIHWITCLAPNAYPITFTGTGKFINRAYRLTIPRWAGHLAYVEFDNTVFIGTPTAIDSISFAPAPEPTTCKPALPGSLLQVPC